MRKIIENVVIWAMIVFPVLLAGWALTICGMVEGGNTSLLWTVLPAAALTGIYISFLRRITGD